MQYNYIQLQYNILYNAVYVCGGSVGEEMLTALVQEQGKMSYKRSFENSILLG